MSGSRSAGLRGVACCMVLALLAVTSGCRVPAAKPTRALQPAPTARIVAEPALVEVREETPQATTPKHEHAISAPRVVKWSARGIAFEGVTFDSRNHQLVVVDQSGGPGSAFATASAAAASVSGIAAVNAGFFTPAGEPIGLVVSAGKVSGVWNAGSSIGSGVWHATPAGKTRIVRRESLGPAAAKRMPELLQSGPMLVESGRAVAGLHGGEPRPRTLIAWDGGHRWWIGVAAPCAMPNMAAALANSSGAGFPIHMALNLDGGRSSELWVAGDITGGPLTRRSVWNRAVRNHLVLVRR